MFWTKSSLLKHSRKMDSKWFKPFLPRIVSVKISNFLNLSYNKSWLIARLAWTAFARSEKISIINYSMKLSDKLPSTPLNEVLLPIPNVRSAALESEGLTPNVDFWISNALWGVHHLRHQKIRGSGRRRSRDVKENSRIRKITYHVRK